MSKSQRDTNNDTAEANNIACSLGRSMNIMGDRWILMIVHSLFMGKTRFSDIRRTTGIARSLLTKRLQRMEQFNIIERRLYDEKLQRFEYVLTKQGIDLIYTALMIVRWERRWHYNPDLVTLNIRDRHCGEIFTPQFCCSACGDVIEIADVELKEGPGAGFEQTNDNSVRRSTITTPDINGTDALLGWAGVILGDRWTSALICSPFFGLSRFNDFQRFWAIAPNILSDRLARLVEFGVMRQKEYQASPVRYEYSLTKKGNDFFPILLMLMSWGDRWLSEKKGPPFYQIHKTCGKRFKPQVRCDGCNELISAKDVVF